MEIFIDTADIKEITHAFSIGIVDGITTNPSLLKKAAEKYKEPIKDYLIKILKAAGKTPVSLEVKGGSCDEMYKQAKNLWKTFSKKGNVVIKIPIDATLDEKKPNHVAGLQTIKRLAKEKIPVNVTLIFTPEQALLAAKAGATYVSPFCGRLDDKIRKDHKIKAGKDAYFPCEGVVRSGKHLSDNGVVSGVDLVSQIVAVFKAHNMKTKVLAASIRNARQARECALVGADIATINPKIIEEMLTHKKSIEGMQSFTADLPRAYGQLMSK